MLPPAESEREESEGREERMEGERREEREEGREERKDEERRQKREGIRVGHDGGEIKRDRK